MFKGLWSLRWRAANDPLRAVLGNLEREVMEVVWSDGENTVRRVQAALPRAVAYTTVMTTLDRLFKKGFVTRTRAGRAFLYCAAQTREQTEAAVASGMVSGLFSSGAAVSQGPVNPSPFPAWQWQSIIIWLPLLPGNE